VTQTETIQRLAAIINLPPKPLNVIQKKKVLDTTPCARREIKYTRFITKYIDLITAELNFRGVVFEEKTKVMKIETIAQKRQYG